MEELVKKSESTAVEIKSKRVRPSRAKPRPELTPLQTTSVPFTAPAPIDPERQRRAEIKAKWMKEKEADEQMVTGKFLFNECPGGELVFYFKKYPGDKREKYTMKHDSIHTIKLGVAKHLNDNCSYPEYQHNMDNGKSVDVQNMYIMSKVHRTSFIPLWATGHVGQSNIAQVTYANPQNTLGILV